MLKLFSLLVKTSPAPPPPEEATQGVTNWLCRTVGKFALKKLWHCLPASTNADYQNQFLSRTLQIFL